MFITNTFNGYKILEDESRCKRIIRRGKLIVHLQELKTQIIDAKIAFYGQRALEIFT
jgi:hypothetical protein